MPQIEHDAYVAAYTKLIENLSFDVDTVVDIALSNGEEILHDKKTQATIAKHIMDEITKELNNMKFSISL